MVVATLDIENAGSSTTISKMIILKIQVKNENRNEDRNDIMQKLVEMFERQTERIILLENSINPRNQSKCS